MKGKSIAGRIASGIFYNFSVTNWLILINVVVFIASLFLPVTTQIVNGQNTTSSLIISNYLAVSGDNLAAGRIWTLFTSVFLHASFAHLFFNMLSLFFVGNFIEKIIGRKRFLYFYLAAGVFASLFFAVLSLFFGSSGIGSLIFLNSSIPAVGASGAIFGLIGLLAVLIPRGKVYLIVGPLIAIIIGAIADSFFPGNIANAINIVANIYIFLSIIALFSFSMRIIKIAVPIEMPFWLLPIVSIMPLIIIGLFVELPIGNTAHLGGLIAGLLYGWYLRRKYKKKVMLLGRTYSR